MTDPNLLRGATTTPAANVQSSTPGEFAARWNTRTPEERQYWLDSIRDSGARAAHCWIQQHEHRIEEAEAQLARIAALCDDPREWDAREADSAEARSARAYNSALDQAAAILRGQRS